jgi:D-tyrosyl-tRNA(Tyr) deacylase
MKLVIQRVKQAKVTLAETDEVVGQIDHGLFILIGIGKDDDENKINELAEKVLKLRIMADKDQKMNLSIKDVEGSILAVSQFTLYADTKGGNRPSFINAAEPEIAKKLYELFINTLRLSGMKVETGRFGEYMLIGAEMDGPVTIILEN